MNRIKLKTRCKDGPPKPKMRDCQKSVETHHPTPGAANPPLGQGSRIHVFSPPLASGRCHLTQGFKLNWTFQKPPGRLLGACREPPGSLPGGLPGSPLGDSWTPSGSFLSNCRRFVVSLPAATILHKDLSLIGLQISSRGASQEALGRFLGASRKSPGRPLRERPGRPPESRIFASGRRHL